MRKPLMPVRTPFYREPLSIAAAVICFFGGTGVWVVVPLVFGDGEPWDSGMNVYVIVLIALGLVGGVLTPWRLWIPPVAVWLGQTIGFVGALLSVNGGGGGLWPVGLFFMVPAMTLFTVVGTMIGMLVGRFIARLRGDERV